MPDIAMCRNEKCKKKMTCYRYRALPGYWQAYADFREPCESYMETTEEELERARRLAVLGGLR